MVVLMVVDLARLLVVLLATKMASMSAARRVADLADWMVDRMVGTKAMMMVGLWVE